MHPPRVQLHNRKRAALRRTKGGTGLARTCGSRRGGDHAAEVEALFTSIQEQRREHRSEIDARA